MRDLNPQVLRQRILSPSSLPISPIQRIVWNLRSLETQAPRDRITESRFNVRNVRKHNWVKKEQLCQKDVPESNQQQLNEFHLVCFHQLSCTLLSFILTEERGFEPPKHSASHPVCDCFGHLHTLPSLINQRVGFEPTWPRKDILPKTQRLINFAPLLWPLELPLQDTISFLYFKKETDCCVYL